MAASEASATPGASYGSISTSNKAGMCCPFIVTMLYRCGWSL